MIYSKHWPQDKPSVIALSESEFDMSKALETQEQQETIINTEEDNCVTLKNTLEEELKQNKFKTILNKVNQD